MNWITNKYLHRIGWAGGGAYYYAKKSVNADRAARHEAGMKRKAQMTAMEAEQRHIKGSDAQTLTGASAMHRANMAQNINGKKNVGSPSSEISQDPAPEPETAEDRILEKSKYQAAEAFRPPKGNRFS
ncbi:hypothetical protein V8E54_004028 [Elaphomyces granulatus]